MAKPAPKTALRKAPGREHPIAPTPEPTPEQPTTQAPAAPATSEAAEKLPMYSVRMDPALRRRAKRWAAEHDTSLQALTAAALSDYLDKRGG